LSGDFYQQVATWSQIAGAIGFAIVLAYLWIRFVQPAVVASQARKNAELVEAEARRDAAKARLDEAQARAADTDASAAAILQRARDDAARLHERALVAANDEGRRLVRNAEGELERGRLAARERLRAELVRRAVQMARSSAARLDDATNRGLVGAVLERIESGAAR
jgi:F0F1-type ATP synthase membrane subunit b/b'